MKELVYIVILFQLLQHYQQLLLLKAASVFAYATVCRLEEFIPLVTLVANVSVSTQPSGKPPTEIPVIVPDPLMLLA